MEDQALVRRAIGEFCALRIMGSGQAAIDAFSNEGSSTGKHNLRPNLVILDYRMPGMPGVEILPWIRTTTSGALTPVIIFSSSSNPDDVARCYRAGCNSYITKPQHWNEYRAALHTIVRYWLDVSTASD